MDIWSGRYSFDEIKKLAEEYQERFRQAAKRTALPKEPDFAKVERLMIDIYEMHRLLT